MKKILVSMLMAGALVAGGTAFAQTQTATTPNASAQKECPNKDGKICKKSGKECHKEQKNAKGNKGAKAARQEFNPFDGIQLTPDQQQKLQVLRQGIGPVVLDKTQQEKIPQNPNLTPEQKQQLKAEKKARKLEAKKKYLNGVKETLTPDQYVIFLENCYLYTPEKSKQKGMKAEAGHKGKKHDKNKSGKDKK